MAVVADTVSDVGVSEDAVNVGWKASDVVDFVGVVLFILNNKNKIG